MTTQGRAWVRGERYLTLLAAVRRARRKERRGAVVDDFGRPRGA